MKVIIINENFSPPFDEGQKKLIYYLAKELNKFNKLFCISSHSHPDIMNNFKIKLNKFLISKKLYNIFRDVCPDVIIYIPQASMTYNSFLNITTSRVYLINLYLLSIIVHFKQSHISSIYLSFGITFNLYSILPLSISGGRVINFIKIIYLN